jgi:hypothetical protein
MWDRELEDDTSSCADDRRAVHDDLVMAMLGHHVPLALLIDLTDDNGPTSAQIFITEGAPETRWWDR